MPLHQLHELNYLAILAAGFGAFILGGLWYTVIFGKLWQRLHGYTPAQMTAMQAARPKPVFFGGMIVCYIISAIAVAMLVHPFGASNVKVGVHTGLLVWVAVAAFAMTGHLASAKPIGVYLIDIGFALIYLPAIGAVVAIWR